MTGRVIIIRADAARLPLGASSVDLIVTSPPYFGMRSYTDDGEHYAGQIGDEATPGEFLEALWSCTREWTRVLKPAGSLFVNLGDKYAQAEERSRNGNGNRRATDSFPAGSVLRGPTVTLGRKDNQGIRTKSLIGIPWRYALGCIDELGLILRAEIIWSKPNGLPESVTDRVRRAHEQIFHFTRQPRYYAGVDEIREAHIYPNDLRLGPRVPRGELGSDAQHGRTGLHPLGKLPGSVWEIPSQPLTVPAELGVDHYAAYPTELPRRCILGWTPAGICTACGEGRRPIIASRITGDRGGRQFNPASGNIGVLGKERVYRLTGYACACPDTTAPARPAIVLDPFGGTGTTALVAAAYGRTGVTVDRSADYCRLAAWRTTDPAERARALLVPKPPEQVTGQASLFDPEATP